MHSVDKIMQRVEELRAKGLSWKKIEITINSEGFRTRRGTPFKHGSLASMRTGWLRGDYSHQKKPVKEDRTDLVKRILGMPGASDSEKIALAQMAMEI